MEHNKESEAVYVAQEDSHMVMSEKVQALAGSIYQEFERMINKYDETVVKELMPLVVNVLECLDLSYTENQEHEVELELLREDNEQLVTQYEREKHLRKSSDQKLLEIEDQTEEQIKELTSKNESLEAILRMLELRAKNSSDHVNRLEDKENEMKKEYAKLHDRYTELFKTHMDYMERTKILMGTDRLENFGMTGMKKLNLNNIMTRSAGPVSYGFTSLEQNSSMLKSIASPDEFPFHSNSSNLSPMVNLQEEMSMEEALDVSDNSCADNVQNGSKDPPSEAQPSKSQNNKEERTGNTLYQEFSFHEPEFGDENAEITGSWVHPGEYASSDFGSEASGSPNAKSPSSNGMGKEVENLILENNELLATKNALNIVKDDLIAKVDELSSEHEILREEIQSQQAVKSRMKLRIQELEDEVKKMKEELEKKAANKSDDEEDVPLAQRRRFTRVEMARVLMERNQYKERFMELQDAVRWTEMLRAAKHDPSLEKKNSRGFLTFFSSLFAKTTPVPVGLTTDRLVSSGGILPQGSPTRVPGGPVPANAINTGPSSSRTEMSAEKLQLRRLGDPQQRRDQTTYKQIKAHVRKDDGRMQAYGWSLPAKSAGSQSNPLLGSNYQKESTGKENKSNGQGKHLPVPVPIYCRPFMEQTPGMKIFCASGVDLTGGRISEGESNGKYTSPHVWICTATHSASRVTIIDANRPADILQTFEVCTSHLLCISCVPGNKDGDLETEEGLIQLDLKDEEDSEVEACGRLSFVHVDPSEIAKMEEQEAKLKTESKTDEQCVLPEATTESACSSKDTSLVDFAVNSAMPTMWLGAQSGFVMVHSAIGHWDTCLHKVRLPDSVLSIVHLRGRTFVSLANGTVAIFLRGKDRQWDLTTYYLLDLENQPHHSIRCVSVVGEDVWCGFRNKIHVLDVYTLRIKKTFEAHPRKESQVRQMAWCGDGVWVSIRLDSTLRLYHAETHEHLQDVDIEPYVSKMLGTGKLGFSYARITALLVASHRLWVGTGNGVIISVPLQELGGFANPGTSSSGSGGGTKGPGSALRVSEHGEPGKEIPYCSMSQAQLSFHGHRDAVKFFVAVPGSSSVLPLTNEMNTDGSGVLPKSNSMLVISGGEGYIDFRVGENDDGESKLEPDPNHPAEKAHIIIWQVATKV